MTDPVRTELRDRLRAKLTGLSAVLDPDAAAEAALSLFYSVVDEWDRVDTSTYVGESWLDQRWLVARIPVQSQAYERKPDRTVRS